jgi:hypothetical protein
MRVVKIRPRRVAGLLGGALAVLLLACVGLWRTVVIPWAEDELRRAVGYDTVIGGLRPGWRSLEARDVQILGAPPFATAPLARIERLRIQLGGDGFSFWQPSEIVARGVQITYLRAGAVDNVEGAAPGTRAAGGRASGGARPRFRLEDGRLEGFIRWGAGPALVVRAGALEGETLAAGARRLQARGVVAEWPGVLTVSAPRLELLADGGTRIVSGAGAVAAVPGGGALVTDVTVAGRATASEAWVALDRERRPDRGGLFHVELRLAPGGGRLGAEIRGLPLQALHPLVRAYGVDPAGAVMDLHAELFAEAGSKSPGDVELEIRGVDLFHPALDRTPWRGIPLAVRASGSVDFARNEVEIDRGDLDLLGLPLVFRGSTELGPPARGRWQIGTAREAPASCAGLLARQPAPIREALRGLGLEGSLGVGVTFGFDATAWENVLLDVSIGPLCRVRREPAALTALGGALWGEGERPPAAAAGLPLGAYHPDFTPLRRMPRHLVAAFVTAEDGRFLVHNGFDLEMIRRALAHDLEVGQFAKGASTITQQLAKNLFLSPERTLGRKLAETVLAWRLNELLDKDRALELYLNVIELGPGIRGVKQAAEVYFGKRLGDLSPLESAHLAALTPNPLGYARRFREGRVDEGWLHRLYDLLGMMRRSGRLSAAELAAARSARLALRKI